MKKFRNAKYKGFKEYNWSAIFLCCLMLCVSMFLASCSKQSTSANDPITSENHTSNIVTQREWVYVPEVFIVEDERADYERMQPVGDTFCYVALGEESGNGTKYICRYSLADGELKQVPVNWPEGGKDWEVGCHFFHRIMDCI